MYMELRCASGELVGGKFIDGVKGAAAGMAISAAVGSIFKPQAQAPIEAGGPSVEAGGASAADAAAGSTGNIPDPTFADGPAPNVSTPNAAPYSRTGVIEEVLVTAPALKTLQVPIGTLGTIFSTSYGGVQRDGIYDMSVIGIGAPIAAAGCASAPVACWGAVKGAGLTHATNQFLGINSTPGNIAFGAVTGGAAAPFMPYLSQGTRVGAMGWDVTLWGAGTGAGVLVP